MASIELEDVVLRTGRSEELVPLATAQPPADDRSPGIVELRQPGAQFLVPGDRFELAARVIGLALRPSQDIRILDVLEIAVWIVDHHPVARRRYLPRRPRSPWCLRLHGKRRH